MKAKRSIPPGTTHFLVRLNLSFGYCGTECFSSLRAAVIRAKDLIHTTSLVIRDRKLGIRYTLHDADQINEF